MVDDVGTDFASNLDLQPEAPATELVDRDVAQRCKTALEALASTHGAEGRDEAGRPG
jgi:hypothetical protein